MDSYGKRLFESLRAMGRSKDRAGFEAKQARNQLETYGLGPTDPIPRITGLQEEALEAAMHERTATTLRELDAAAWFSRVGITETDSAIVLSSWDKAIKHCSSLKWDNLRLEAANQYCERLLERSRDRFVKWNDVVRDIRRPAIDLVERKIAPVVREHRLPEIFRQVVSLDIVYVCMEAEYADVYPPRFYASQAYWYVNGHFPCGWKGRFPEGTLIIY